MTKQSEILVQDIDHLGIIAGIVDEMGLVEEIDSLLGKPQQMQVSAGQVVKAMILNGLGFVSAPLYLFEQFFVGKATEHLIGAGVRPEHLNDDRLGRVLDKLHKAGLSQVFLKVALQACKKYHVSTSRVHLDSSSFHVDGEYASSAWQQRSAMATSDSASTPQEDEAEPRAIYITHGYSRDHRPDLKQFVMDLICTGDGDVPLYLRLADGNEADKAVFAHLMKEFQQQWTFEQIQVMVADSALYSEDNLKSLGELPWICRVPATLSQAKQLLQAEAELDWVASSLEGYHIAQQRSDYGGVEQRWLVVESEVRKQADLKQLEKRLNQHQERANKQLQALSRQEFSCEPDALKAAKRFERQLKFHALEAVEVIEQVHHEQAGRPRKDTQAKRVSYHLQATLVLKQTAIQAEVSCAGRFILATNITEPQQLSNHEVLQEYKAQQSSERGFRFLKEPLFFTSSVFVKSPKRLAALAMVMGLCLLVYSLGQRQLRQTLVVAGDSIKNQLGKATQSPTLRWVFQCFQAVHLLQVAGSKQVSNLSDERKWILRFLAPTCRQYYLLC
ncbi:MAG: IS1634 family transposase [Microcoleus sp. SIO2G3]|nr:IS1634 family transposase [Microcoleus sp. SIO2G3]